MESEEQKRFYNQLGERVQRARRKRGITQEGLASLVGLTRTSIVNIEKGRQKVLCHSLVEFTRALRVSAFDLLPPATAEMELDSLLKSTPLSTQEFVRSVVQSSEKRKR